jgi:hypothetical protein
MKLKKGDRVRLVSQRPATWNQLGEMDEYLGTIQTVKEVWDDSSFHIEDTEGKWRWTFSTKDVVETLPGKAIEPVKTTFTIEEIAEKIGVPLEDLVIKWK